MSIIINEAPDDLPELPSGFPVCHNFYNDEEKDKIYVETGKTKQLLMYYCIMSI